MKQSLKIKGHLKQITYLAATGEIVDVEEDHNLVLDQAIEFIFRALSTSDSNTYVVNSVYIGTDVGGGTLLEPAAPTSGMTEDDQDVAFEIPTVNFSVSYPEPFTVRYTATLVGEDVMADYPSQPNLVYTSATLRTVGEKAIAYRRFTPRTISDVFNIQLIWTLTITPEEE